MRQSFQFQRVFLTVISENFLIFEMERFVLLPHTAATVLLIFFALEKCVCGHYRKKYSDVGQFIDKKVLRLQAEQKLRAVSAVNSQSHFVKIARFLGV